jgi:hypothetical protein
MDHLESLRKYIVVKKGGSLASTYVASLGSLGQFGGSGCDVAPSTSVFQHVPPASIPVTNNTLSGMAYLPSGMASTFAQPPSPPWSIGNSALLGSASGFSPPLQIGSK